MLNEINPSNSNDLDISVLYSILRNIGDLKTSDWGKLPGNCDRSPVNDIERIRIYRNKISHEKSYMMTTEEFNKSALELIEVNNTVLKNLIKSIDWQISSTVMHIIEKIKVHRKK